ncbi:MAG: tetratricopeptide repeat protein, partial [Thermodesulfovibrionales bacterium]|nr:tetratricopeptide repeat protein [Thermodesulfovibrionales bacterium]
FWFFITLSVESSIIPIPMVINEYRLYLPSFGAFAAAAGGALILLKGLKSDKLRMITISFIAIIPLIFSYAAYARNAVWGSEISLWEDVVKKSPQKARVHYNLGTEYLSHGLSDRAIEQYMRALQLNHRHAKAHGNLALAYISKGLIDKSIEHSKAALELNPNISDAHMNLGSLYLFYKKNMNEAIRHYEAALRLDPRNAKAHLNLSIAYKDMGLPDKAGLHSAKARELNPDLFR